MSTIQISNDDKLITKRLLYILYEQNARNDGVEFSISYEDFIKIISDSCYYCGANPSTVERPPLFLHNGINRIDNSFGYTLKNCVACCPVCNIAKGDMNEEQFLSWIKQIWLHRLQTGVQKSPGELIDSLITTDVKCFMFQEKQLDSSSTEEDRLKYANIVLELNKKRNMLMRAIDFTLGFENLTVTPKTYLENLDNQNLAPEY